MKHPFFTGPFAAAALLILPGCAGDLAYPSLAPRAVEKGDMVETPPVPTAAALDPDVTTRVAALTAQARQGNAAFEAATRNGCAAIGRGQGVVQGSEAWVASQQAISIIEAARAPTVAALNDLDALLVDKARAAEDSPTPVDLSPLTSAIADIAAIDSAQRDRLNDFREKGCRL